MIRLNMGPMKKVTVLFSGGIDSTSAAILLKSAGLTVRGLFINFGQASQKMEQRSVARLKDIIGISVDEIHVGSRSALGIGELTGRNTFLISAALLLGNCDSGGIAIGIHSGTSYYDCSPDFAEKIDELVRQCSGGRLSIVAPFIRWSKDDVYSYFLSQNIPLHETYSCEAGTSPPCRRCMSCRDRVRLECSLNGAQSG
jgi:7-cyano-7-deazaguanine synthase